MLLLIFVIFLADRTVTVH